MEQFKRHANHWRAVKANQPQPISAALQASKKGCDGMFERFQLSQPLHKIELKLPCASVTYGWQKAVCGGNDNVSQKLIETTYRGAASCIALNWCAWDRLFRCLAGGSKHTSVSVGLKFEKNRTAEQPSGPRSPGIIIHYINTSSNTLFTCLSASYDC